MAEPESSDGQKPNIDIVRDLKANEQKLSLHLENHESIEGKIVLFDKFNLMVEDNDGDRFWVPKHAVTYARLL
jgi:sRNA-binding regulator protein Hfq